MGTHPIESTGERHSGCRLLHMKSPEMIYVFHLKNLLSHDGPPPPPLTDQGQTFFQSAQEHLLQLHPIFIQYKSRY